MSQKVLVHIQPSTGRDLCGHREMRTFRGNSRAGENEECFLAYGEMATGQTSGFEHYFTETTALLWILNFL